MSRTNRRITKLDAYATKASQASIAAQGDIALYKNFRHAGCWKSKHKNNFTTI